jgi:hypothetical protein
LLINNIWVANPENSLSFLPKSSWDTTIRLPASQFIFARFKLLFFQFLSYLPADHFQALSFKNLYLSHVHPPAISQDRFLLVYSAYFPDSFLPKINYESALPVNQYCPYNKEMPRHNYCYPILR